MWRPASVLFGAALHILQTECRLLRVTFLQWHMDPVPAGTTVFTSHRRGIDAFLFWALLPEAALETFLADRLMRHVMPHLATVVADLSLVGLLYLVGVAKSFRLYPTTLDDNALTLRLGLLRERRIERRHIIDCSPASLPASGPIRRLRFCLLDAPDVALLVEAQPVRDRIEFALDEPQRLMAALRRE